MERNLHFKKFKNSLSTIATHRAAWLLLVFGAIVCFSLSFTLLSDNDKGWASRVVRTAMSRSSMFACPAQADEVSGKVYYDFDFDGEKEARARGLRGYKFKFSVVETMALRNYLVLRLPT